MAKETIRQRRLLSLTLLRISIFAVAILLIVLGVANGGMKDVWEKAIRICSECIGLG